MAGILKIRNPDTGEFVEIPAIQGVQGPQGEVGPQGPQGPQGDQPPLSTSAPLALGVASSGSSTTASREDHIHPMPSAADIGAASVEEVNTLKNSTVPTSRTINGKALNGDVSLTYSDVGAAAASHTHSYLPLDGGTISNSSFGPFFIERTSSTYGASIGFKNGNGVLGYIGMSNDVDGGAYRWTADTNAQYKMYDQGNLSFSLSGTTLTITTS